MTRGARASLLRPAILVSWIALLVVFCRYEAFPEYFTHALPGYRSLLSGDVLLEDSWTRILFKDHPIGYSHTAVEVDETDPLKHYTMRNQTYVRLKAMGLNQPVFVDTVAEVDLTHRLQQFSFSLSSRGQSMRIRGDRAGTGDEFDVTMRTGTSNQKLSVHIPDDVILYSPMTEMAMKRLRPGGELTIRTFDPASLSPARMVVRALREEPFVANGVETKALLLETEMQGITVRSWVAKDGTMLRQETPLGWTLVNATADEALATVRESADGGDWISDFAVRPVGVIRDSRAARVVRLRLSGADLDVAALASNRQSAEAGKDGAVEITIKRARVPGTGAAAGEPVPPLDAAARQAALASTPYVQADHPEILACAAAIVKGLTGDVEKARAIFRWVHDNVRKEVTVSLPSALDVLHTRAGDCNEHTYLFTALARASGIPAKIMIGLAYAEGAFYYHAWPAVFVGGWLEMDPTWGQEAVDPTHLRLIEGELERQLDIIKLVGRLKIEVLEAE